MGSVGTEKRETDGVSAEYDIEQGVIDILKADTSFKTNSVRHWVDNSEERIPGVVVECESKQPDILDASGKAATWKTRMNVTPVTYADDDKDLDDIEQMTENTHRVVEALTAASLNAKLTGQTVNGFEADSGDRQKSDRWNERTVSRIVYFSITITQPST